MHQLTPYCPSIFKCQFQVLELMVERILQSTHLGKEASKDQKSQVNNYGLENEFVVFSQWSCKHPSFTPFIKHGWPFQFLVIIC